MTNQDLAKFYNISTQAVGRWSVEKRKQKTVQALSGAKQPIVDLIADINKLAYIYDCQWLHGVEQIKSCWINRTSVMLHCYVFNSKSCKKEVEISANLHAADTDRQLQSIKTKLEELVYG